MPEEPEAELRATANLSPVSPSPVHTASPLVVPTLQDTVDTIDAMVAAAAATNGDFSADQANGVSQQQQQQQPRRQPDAATPGEDDEFVDDDNDPYGDETVMDPALAEAPPAEQPDISNDDYAKTFDSPIRPGECVRDDDDDDEVDIEGEHEHLQDTASDTRESNNVPQSTDALRSHPPTASHPISEPSTITPSAAHLETDSAPTAESHPHSTEAGRSDSQPHVGVPAESGSEEADLRQLVAELTTQTAEQSSNSDVPVSSSATAELPAAASSLPSSAALPSSSSLPPRPPEPNAPSQSYPAQHHPTGSKSSLSGSAAAQPTPGQPSTYVAAGAPGTAPEGVSNLPPPPATGLHASTAVQSLNAPPYPTHPTGHIADRRDDDYQSRWDQFVADERQYMSEARWDRFPEGSRIFIGNLSSDKVSKRDVFDLFHRFGRLAQISLKSAYGFVQYHTAEEGHSAIESLQDVEIKGRRVHLEISKAQEKSKKDRGRSPDKGRGSRDGGRRNDRFSGQRDEYRGRNHSPRRSNDFYDSRGRDRGFHDSGRGRGRSRSPGYGRNGKDSYRRRSPSPYSGSRHDPELDLPRRYGADVPDVQILLLADLDRGFVAWVEGAFHSKGLTTNNMFLHPRMPRDHVVQRQAVEGVHAIVDLDARAQSMGKMPLQVFDRSTGSTSVGFHQYVDLDPTTAAEVVLRAKAASVPSYGQTYNGGAPGGGYPHGYPSLPVQQSPPAPPNNYYGAPQPGAYPPQHPPQQQPPPAVSADIASLMSKVDPATLQQLLAAVQPQGGAPGAPANVPLGHAPQVGQADLQAILSNLSGGSPAAPQHAPPHGQYANPYGGQQAAPPGPHGQSGSGDPSAQVQNIMAHLSRYRQ